MLSDPERGQKKILEVKPLKKEWGLRQMGGSDYLPPSSSSSNLNSSPLVT